MEIGIIVVLAAVLAIIATVLTFIYIVPEKRRERLGNFGKFLHDTVNFKYLIIEKILQASYILATSFTLLIGVLMLFYVEEGYKGRYYSSPDVWYGGYGLLIIILGPIAIRIVYEFVMMALLLVKNVMQINNKMKTPEGKADDIFAAPAKEAYTTTIPNTFCTQCGQKLNEDGTCPQCGK